MFYRLFQQTTHVVKISALTIVSIMFSVFFSSVYAAELSYFLPNNQSYNANVPTPQQTLGFEIGERHARHDQLLAYFHELAKKSNKVSITNIGRTAQYREQILVTISSAENIANLSTILKNRNDKSVEQPLVVWLGYSVHGDEISGANAAMVAAYYYAASQDKSIESILKNTIIVMEPSINPDGMDRFVNWANTFRGKADNADPEHIEHHQHWPSGRTNHYWFDLNRDWLLLSQVESQNRLPYFHQYRPNVLGDFHEMGANSSYFFQPGIPTRVNPHTPKENTELTQEIAKFHAKALDGDQRLYYSEESYDDFYYGKGSTYPDVNGAIGILFEQASSRGYQQETINGLLTFEFGIKNHVLTSLSTVEGAWQNKARLQEYQTNFYKDVSKLAKKESFVGYVVHENKDRYRFNEFLSKLAQHQIHAYALEKDIRVNNDVYSATNSYFIPLDQPQYRLIKSLFSTETDFEDNTFYDVSGWTLPFAMNIEFAKVDRTWGLKLSSSAWKMPAKESYAFNKQAYAYAFEWHDYLAPKLLNTLLDAGLKVRVATRSFTSVINEKTQNFDTGTIVIPAGIQAIDNWREVLKLAADKNNLPIFALQTGLTPNGIDIGSNSFEVVDPIKILLVGGPNVSQYEAGEMRYYLDEQLNIPVSVIEQARLSRISLADYTHIVMVDGNYSKLSDNVVNQLSTWLNDGGVIIAQKRATKWLVEKEWLKVPMASKSQIDQLFDISDLSYADKETLAGRKRIAGAIFETKIDQSHPLTYGIGKDKLALFRNSTLIFNDATSPFLNVAQYTNEPLLSGYTDKNLVNKVANSPAIVGQNVGSGRIIASTDVLTFRGYWFGSAKVVANGLFFAKAFSSNP